MNKNLYSDMYTNKWWPTPTKVSTAFLAPSQTFFNRKPAHHFDIDTVFYNEYQHN